MAPDRRQQHKKQLGEIDKLFEIGESDEASAASPYDTAPSTYSYSGNYQAPAASNYLYQPSTSYTYEQVEQLSPSTASPSNSSMWDENSSAISRYSSATTVATHTTISLGGPPLPSTSAVYPSQSVGRATVFSDEIQGFAGPDGAFCILEHIFEEDCSQMPRRDLKTWRRHVLSHFNAAGPPTHALCVFCNYEEEHSNAGKCWDKYLKHVFIHLQSGSTRDEMKPDYLTLGYLRDKRLITDSRYNDLVQPYYQQQGQ